MTLISGAERRFANKALHRSRNHRLQDSRDLLAQLIRAGIVSTLTQQFFDLRHQNSQKNRLEQSAIVPIGTCRKVHFSLGPSMPGILMSVMIAWIVLS